MVELDQYKYQWNQYKDSVKELEASFNIEVKKERLEEIEASMEEQDFWENVEKSQKLTKEMKQLKNSLDTINGLVEQYNEIGVLIEMGEEEEDLSIVDEVENELKDFIENFEKVKIQTLLSGEYDKYDAILKINAGAGGTESCDWAGMLYRMYTRWAESKGFETEVIDYLDGDEAGIKSITFQVKGENAFGSFASCDVMPDIEEDLDVEINDDDIRIDTYRSSGAGGQHINKTSSAIRITHLPTGIVVQCQNERSQLQNKDKAMKMLKAKLYILKKQEEEEKRSGIRGEVKEIGWGNQIRSYVMQPYTMVKDHRTGEEVTDVGKVMDGYIDPFINSYLKWLNIDKDKQ